MQRIIVRTGDGSASVYMPEFDEHYHSKHGAIQESQHVFIEAGLAFVAARQRSISILEVGFGTGLNAYLSGRYAQDQQLQLDYHAVEPFPLPAEILDALNYPVLLGQSAGDPLFGNIHAAPWNEHVQVLPSFTLTKYACTIQELSLSTPVDLVYFDAFAPRVQPELWSADVFQKIALLMKPGAVLVTYCAKGEVKRNMRAAGLTVEALPGPPGKREMTRAFK
jgi:tRNA U34 5-methylaminomethyl-2-thiouridine-forming methyltransferase MnmC